MSQTPSDPSLPPPLPPSAQPRSVAPQQSPPPPPPRTSVLRAALIGAVPVIGGAVIGLGLRLAFNGNPGTTFATMLWIFILLAPFAIGAVTVYLAERIRPRSTAYHFFMPMLSVCLCLLGSMMVMLEGAICVLLIAPVFAVMSAVGGIVMGVICRAAGWSKTPTVYSFVALPIVLALLGVGQDEPRRFEHVERKVLIQAPPTAVWKVLLDADHIRADEVDRAWMYRIGVPTPLAGLTHQTPTGLVREVRMGKGIHFRQMSADWRPQRYVHWQYQFEEDSVPAGALDDHVRIGGDYFDLLDTRYTLTPRGDATELSIRMDYRVSTGFNWYTVPLADGLIGNFSEVILEFYRHRAEAPASAG
ncbi:hypothetical protein [Lysobacter sp. TAB13]|uniref:hypothetical protein n=1 Tax=Lysobacter sp. TAB13 TaxID=3233065 RepID=UPI003F9A0FF6